MALKTSNKQIENATREGPAFMAYLTDTDIILPTIVRRLGQCQKLATRTEFGAFRGDS